MLMNNNSVQYVGVLVNFEHQPQITPDDYNWYCNTRQQIFLKRHVTEKKLVFLINFDVLNTNMTEIAKLALVFL